MSSTAIIRLNFDLVRDVEAHIGSVCGKYRSYSQADVSDILECVAQKMKRENQRLSNIGAFDEVSPEELVQFDITFSGRVHPGVFGSISVNLSKWDDVAGFELVQPYEVPYRVFPLPVGMPEKMEYLV